MDGIIFFQVQTVDRPGKAWEFEYLEAIYSWNKKITQLLTIFFLPFFSLKHSDYVAVIWHLFC